MSADECVVFPLQRKVQLLSPDKQTFEVDEAAIAKAKNTVQVREKVYGGGGVSYKMVTKVMDREMGAQAGRCAGHQDDAAGQQIGAIGAGHQAVSLPSCCSLARSRRTNF